MVVLRYLAIEPTFGHAAGMVGTWVERLGLVESACWDVLTSILLFVSSFTSKMKSPAALWSALLAITQLSNAYSNFTLEAAEFHVLTSKALADGQAKLAFRETAARANGTESSCTSDNLVYRREYGALSRDEKLDYVRAVKCLQSLPPRTPANVSSGARSRFDDFVVTHIQQTLTIHFSGYFLPWHRWFVYSYEKALRDECGYQGYQPYWDWPRYAAAPQDSPLFDGSDTCLGGNGDFIVHDGPLLVSPTNASLTLQLPPGVGSGNVTTGPFANMTVNLGPVGGLNNTAPGPDGGLGYNPRNLKRDLGPAVNERYANYSTTLSKSAQNFVKWAFAYQMNRPSQERQHL